jgi:hypothetical protein
MRLAGIVGLLRPVGQLGLVTPIPNGLPRGYGFCHNRSNRPSIVGQAHAVKFGEVPCV